MREEITRSPVHKINMSQNTELKNILTNWLLEEGVTLTQSNDEDVEFRLRVTWGYVIDVVKLRGMHRVVSTARMSFDDPDIKKVFTKLSKKDKKRLEYEIQTELVKFPIGYTIHPDDNFENLEAIDFNHTIYTADLTKTCFFESIDIIRRAMLCVSAIFNNRTNIDMEMSSSPENKAGVG